jgi:hypothetical protein
MVPYQNHDALVAEIKAKIETFKARSKEHKEKYVSPHVIFFSSPFL